MSSGGHHTRSDLGTLHLVNSQTMYCSSVKGCVNTITRDAEVVFLSANRTEPCLDSVPI